MPLAKVPRLQPPGESILELLKPLNFAAVQVVTDFFDQLKSLSQGYASMEYKISGYRRNDLVRLDIKVCCCGGSSKDWAWAL